MFKNTKGIVWILHPVCKILKDFDLYFIKYKKLFLEKFVTRF
jgi:hypothetical protein